MYYNELYTGNITGFCLVSAFALYLVGDVNAKLSVELNGVSLMVYLTDHLPNVKTQKSVAA